MKNRRNFLKSSALLATGMAVSAPLLAKTKSKKTPVFPGVVFTDKYQGKWDGKAGSHVPKVKVEGSKVTLHTEHGMSERHYIVRHTLVDQQGNMLGAKTFYPSDEQAISVFILPAGFHGKLYATSFCNKHDFWLKEFSV
jgi:superoxide reductase